MRVHASDPGPKPFEREQPVTFLCLPGQEFAEPCGEYTVLSQSSNPGSAMRGFALMLTQNHMLDPDASTFAPVHLHACRFFCGPNAKKSAALAKQQKKRPRGDGKEKGKQPVADLDIEDDSDAASDSGTVFACSSISCS